VQSVDIAEETVALRQYMQLAIGMFRATSWRQRHCVESELKGFWWYIVAREPSVRL
jgi:hypothetical protein